MSNIDVLFAKHVLVNHPNCDTAITLSGKTLLMDRNRATWREETEDRIEKSSSVPRTLSYAKVAVKVPIHAVRNYQLSKHKLPGRRTCRASYTCSCKESIIRGQTTFTNSFLRHVKTKHFELDTQIFASVPTSAKIKRNDQNEGMDTYIFIIADQTNRTYPVHNQEQVQQEREG